MDYDGDDEIDFEGRIIRETERAFLFQVDGMDEACWLPKSRCVWESDIQRMMVPKWLARRTGILP